MSATVHSIAVARLKRAARIVNAAASETTHCACGCGAELHVDERIAWDSRNRVGYRLLCWLRVEGLR